MRSGDTAERYMRLALKAQAQSRSTWETLAAIKNPHCRVRTAGEHTQWRAKIGASCGSGFGMRQPLAWRIVDMANDLAGPPQASQPRT